jgi:hypothetical protein
LRKIKSGKMTGESFRLPFSIQNVYQGLAEAGGIISVRQEGLLLEFQVKDSFLGGLIKAKPRELLLRYTDIESIVTKSNIFRTVLKIRTHTLAAVADLPNSDRGEITLHLKRADRERAAQLVSRANLRISELRLSESERLGLYED